MTKKSIVMCIFSAIFVVISMLGVAPETGIAGMIINIVFIIAGFVFLIKGADIFVENASKIALKFNIPQMVIGLTIVAFGTSLPEAAVSIKGAFSGNVGITVGNVVGSNILNILLILGISSCIATLAIKKNTLRYEIPFVIFITALLLGLGMWGKEISRIDGVIFLVLMAGFMVYMVHSAKTGEADDDDSTKLTDKDTMPRLILFVVLGGACIVLGSDVTVNAASYIAGEFGMSVRLIGLTIVAFGTSLPELITSATAAKRGKVDIAIGNIVGSNIFNIIFVVGVCSVITPITFEAAFIKDTIVAIAAAVLLLLCVFKNKKLSKSGGIIMLLCFVAYYSYIIIMNYA